MAKALQAISAQSAGKLIGKFTAGESISALRVVYLDDNDTVFKADADDSTKIQVLGIALNAAVTGGQVSVLTFGVAEDASFTFGASVPLYLQNDGFITDLPPEDVPLLFNVKIGFGLGASRIYVKPERPIEN